MADERTAPPPLTFHLRRRPTGILPPYQPSVRPHWFFIMAVPWLTVLALAAGVAMALGMRSILPGVPMTLPQASFSAGDSGVVMLLVVPDREGDTQVFLDDDRFGMASEERRAKLGAAIAASLARHDTRAAHLYVDARVTQGDLVEVMDLLRETPLEQVNIVIKP